MNPLSKVENALREPEQIRPFLEESVRAVVDLLSRGRIAQLFGLLTAGVLGRNLYLSSLERRADGEYVTCEIHGNRMYIDPEDTGISHDLVTYGQREIASTEVFRRELRRLAGDVDGDVTVLEVGANIGYFALQEADVLGDRARIHTFEPSPKNVDLLTRNIERNGFDDRFVVNQAAVGDEPGSVELQIASESNLHSVAPDGAGATASGETTSGETIEVDMYSLDAYLEEQDVDPDDVNVVRMDVEGYEVEVFEGMTSILEADGPLLVFLEFHPQLRTPGELASIYESLDENGFEIVSATTTIHTGPYEVDLDVDSYDDLYGMDSGGRIIVRR